MRGEGEVMIREEIKREEGRRGSGDDQGERGERERK